MCFVVFKPLLRGKFYEAVYHEVASIFVDFDQRIASQHLDVFAEFIVFLYAVSFLGFVVVFLVIVVVLVVVIFVLEVVV